MFQEWNPMFQFHEGPIKTVDKSFTDLRVIRFQFHEGPIKTSYC